MDPPPGEEYEISWTVFSQKAKRFVDKGVGDLDVLTQISLPGFVDEFHNMDPLYSMQEE